MEKERKEGVRTKAHLRGGRKLCEALHSGGWIYGSVKWEAAELKNLGESWELLLGRMGGK